MTTSSGSPAPPAHPMHRVRRLRLHSQHQPIVVMRADCDVCRAEGFAARSQVLVANGARQVQATLFQVEGEAMLALDEIGMSETAWKLLGVAEGDELRVSHPPAMDSLADVRRRIYGNRLKAAAFSEIVRDVVAGRYTDVHLAAFLTASAALPLDEEETINLTRAMVDVGERLRWNASIVVDKHCVGGLPGNRTTPIVVAIVAANGLIMPKTSSRAITSPAGTADMMETLAPIDLDIATLAGAWWSAIASNQTARRLWVPLPRSSRGCSEKLGVDPVCQRGASTGRGACRWNEGWPSHSDMTGLSCFGWTFVLHKRVNCARTG